MKVNRRAASDYYPHSEVWHVHSAVLGDDFRICITAPAMPAESQAMPVRAVYATDAPWLSGALVSAAHGGAMDGSLPPLLAVSIGYPLDCKSGHAIRRGRDLTPTPRPDYDLWAAGIFEGDAVASGGAAGFLEFLGSELQPEIASAFSADPNDATLAGASLGGLFTLYGLLEKPEHFRRYLAISPSLWWQSGALLAQAEVLVAASPPPQARVYLCAGALETFERAEARRAGMSLAARSALPSDLRQVDTLRDLVAIETILSQWTNGSFALASTLLAGESHGSVAGAAFSHGLRSLFRDDL